jgi:hypothetical protein
MPMNEDINKSMLDEGLGTPIVETNFSTGDEPLVKRSIIDFDKFKAQTGEGELEEYKNHPLNWNNSKSVARIIRGFTGLLGELNFAVVDILIGFFELTNKKKGIANNGTDIRGNGGVS